MTPATYTSGTIIATLNSNSYTNICVQPYPKPKVSLGRSSTKICSSGIVGGGNGIDNNGKPLGNGNLLRVPMVPQPV